MKSLHLEPEDRHLLPRLQDALADDLYRRALLPQLVFVPFLLLLYMVLDDVIAKRPAIGWVFVAVALLIVPRLLSILGVGWLRQRFPNPGVRIWIFTAGAAATGIGLGLINLLSASVISVEHVALLACAAAGFNSIAIVSMNASLRAYFLSMLPNFGSIPLLIMLGPPLQHRTVFMISVMVNLLALIGMAIHVHVQTARGILMRIKLDAVNVEIGQTNRELQREITERLAVEHSLAQRNADLESANEVLADTQSQLLQSEKLASIGQLAAGVAHEINNPIAFVRANLHSLEGYAGDILKLLAALDVAGSSGQAGSLCDGVWTSAKTRIDTRFLREDIPALLSESIDGATRIENIVKDLRTFSHLDEAQWQQADLHKGLDSTINVAAHALKYKVEVVRRYGSLPLVQCLPFQINQVFLNLIVNAAQAIEHRGVITLTTGCNEDEAWIEIADTGAGIEPAHLRRIFEPFFTTKPVGVGTGLGLSVSYSIVRRHAGSIDVTSVVGKGSTFTIRLPLAGQCAASAAAILDPHRSVT